MEDPVRWSRPPPFDPNANLAYDAGLIRNGVMARIQIKMMRSEKHQPMVTKPKRKDGLPGNIWIVETQKTRSTKAADGVEVADTRPYRFGEFDILAVSVHPATRNWSQFYYTLGDWLLPRPDNADLLRVYQPVPLVPDGSFYTDDLEQAYEWFNNHRTAPPATKRNLFDIGTPRT